MRQKRRSIAEIAERLGRTRSSVNAYIKRNKHSVTQLPRRHQNERQPWSERDDTLIIELAESSTGIKRMRQILKRSSKSIRDRLRTLRGNGSIIRRASPELLTARAVSQLLGVSDQTVRNWVRYMALPAIIHETRSRRFHVIHSTDLWHWLARPEHQHVVSLATVADPELAAYLREQWSREEWLNMAQVADRLCIGSAGAFHWRTRGWITCYYPYRNYCVVRRDELERAIKEQRPYGQRQTHPAPTRSPAPRHGTRHDRNDGRRSLGRSGAPGGVVASAD
jgi:transposase